MQIIFYGENFHSLSMNSISLYNLESDRIKRYSFVKH